MQRPFSAYQGNEPYIFVCYSHDDADLVYPEIQRLHELGFHIWYDEGIAPGSEWSETLARQIRHCSKFLYFVTPSSVASEHCRREINFALEQPCAMVAVHLRRTNLPDGLKLTLSNRQAILKYEHPQASYESKLHQVLSINGEEDAPGRRTTVTIGEWTLDVGTERLLRDGKEHALDPKELSVLLHLIDRAPDVVTTEGLLSRTWPGVVVGDNALQQVITRLRRALGDDARDPRYIETLPKRGYRLCIPVSESDIRAEAAGPAPMPASGDGTAAAPPGRTAWRRFRLPALLALTGLLLFGLVAAYWRVASPPADEAARRPSIAVERFTYPSDEPRLEGYSTLLRNEVVSHLARLVQPGMDLTQRVDEADFLVKGSMTEASGSVRLYVEVLDTVAGTTLWSKAMSLPDSPTRDLIATRPEHLATIVSQIGPLSRWAASLTDSPEAAREWIAGYLEQEELWQGLGGDWRAAFNHFERASRFDPEFVLPPFFLSNLYVNRLGKQARYEDIVEPMHEYTRRVMELEPDWTFHLSWVNLHDFDYEATAANLEYARRHTQPPAHFLELQEGHLMFRQGRFQEAVEHYTTALEMGAGSNQAAAHAYILGAQYLAGRYEAAVRAGEIAAVESAGTGAYAHLPVLIIKAKAEYFNGDPGRAAETIEQAWSSYGKDYPASFAGPLALLGETERAKELLGTGEARWAANEGCWAVEYFWGHYHLGDFHRAFVWMVRAIENREDHMIAAMHGSPLLDPIRDDPRFLAAMERLDEVEAIGTPITSVAYP